MSHKKKELETHVATLPRQGTIEEAACLMRKHNVGDVIVVEENVDGRQIPVGIVTDRDIVVSVIANKVPIESLKVEDIMSEDLVLAHKETSDADLISMMRTKGVKRIPIVNKDGYLEGIVSADNLLEWVAAELLGLAKTPMRERKIERGRRSSHQRN